MDKDYIINEADRRAVREGMTYRPELGARAVTFIETFCRPTAGRVAGDGWRLFDWQRNVVQRLFSWVRKDQTRRFRTGYVSVGRQNGKSALASWVSLYLLLADGEENPCIVSAALTAKQAAIIYENIEHCCNTNERLEKATALQPYLKTVKAIGKNGKPKGKYFSISREAYSNLGPSISGLILDEYAFWPSNELPDALGPAMAARRNPLCLAITTASTLFTGPGHSQYLYAKKVQDSTVDDPSFFSAIYEADEGCPVDDEAQWHKANPALKHGSLSREELSEAATKAKHSKADELAFRYYRLNNYMKGLTSFTGADRWDACRDTFPDLSGCPLYLGLDLGSSRDLSGLTGVIPHNGRFYILAHAWAPEAAARDREKNNQQRYESFKPDLTITPGNGTDYRQIRQYIKELANKYEVMEIIADPNAGANETLMELMGEGYKVFSFTQSARNYNNPTRRLEALILDKLIVHDGQDLLRWQMLNFHTETSGDWIQPVKSKDRLEKNDNVVALLMALSRATTHDTTYKPQTSPYENAGVFLL